MKSKTDFLPETYSYRERTPNIWWSWAQTAYRAGTVLLDRSFEAMGTNLTQGHATSMDEAALILADIQLHLPATFMYGTAIELQLKAIIVAQKCLPADSGFSDRLKSHVYRNLHDLVGLAAASEIDFKDHEIEQLKQLTRILGWAGRYPISKRLGDFDVDLMDFNGTHMYEMRRRIEDIYGKLNRILFAIQEQHKTANP